MTRRRFAPALIVGLALACTRGGESTAPPIDAPPPEPPPVTAEIAPEPPPEQPPEPEQPPAPTLDLLASAAEAGGLTTFLSAVDVAGLRETLQGPGPFTIFAPSDKAFAAMAKGELDRLLKNKKKLAALLQNHVVAGPPLPGAAYVVRSAGAPEPAGGEPAATGSAPILTLAGTALPPLPELVRADIAATNGALHIIDVVLPAPGAKPKAVKPAKAETSAKPAEAPKPEASAKPADKSAAPAKTDTSAKPADKSAAPAKTDTPAKPTDKPAEAPKPEASAKPASKPASKPADKPAAPTP